jgi:hypothetical protein
VRVYSVTDDGRVLLGWRTDRAVTEWSPGDRAVPICMEEGQRYRIVFVAVPEEAGPEGFGAGLVDRTHCIAAKDTGLDLRRLPVEGAAKALTFGVVEPGHGDCPASPEDAKMAQSIRDALGRMPPCP